MLLNIIILMLLLLFLLLLLQETDGDNNAFCNQIIINISVFLGMPVQSTLLSKTFISVDWFVVSLS